MKRGGDISLGDQIRPPRLRFPSCLSPANIYNPETVGGVRIKLEVARLYLGPIIAANETRIGL